MKDAISRRENNRERQSKTIIFAFGIKENHGMKNHGFS